MDFESAADDSKDTPATTVLEIQGCAEDPAVFPVGVEQDSIAVFGAPLINSTPLAKNCMSAVLTAMQFLYLSLGSILKLNGEPATKPVISSMELCGAADSNAMDWAASIASALAANT
jgi:hypothetical protein